MTIRASVRRKLARLSRSMANPVAVVYCGAASPEDSECPAAVQEALGSHFEVVFAGDHCDMDVPTALATLQPAIYIQPGGGDDMAEAWAAVGPVKSAIREYVRGGGRYVGICMGAFLSSKGAEDDDFEGFDLLSEAGWDAHDYKETEGADVTDMNQTLVEVEWRSNNARIFFQGGPSFVKLPAEQVTGRIAGEVLATYTNGDAAAIVVPFGDGKVGVIGPHPEATKSWYADVVNDGGPEGEPVHDLFLDLISATLSETEL